MHARSLFHPGVFGAVVAGGVIGVALRELLLLPFNALDDSATVTSPLGTIPLATAAVNIVGSFALGAVAGMLGTQHPLWRAFLGTGVIGGFTTYSAFAVQSATLLSAAPVVGIALVVVSVLLGLVSAALGVRLTTKPPGEASDGPPTGSEAES